MIDPREPSGVHFCGAAMTLRAKTSLNIDIFARMAINSHFVGDDYCVGHVIVSKCLVGEEIRDEAFAEN